MTKNITDDLSNKYSNPKTYSIVVRNEDGTTEKKIFNNDLDYYKGLDLALKLYSIYFTEGNKYNRTYKKEKKNIEKNIISYFDFVPDIYDYLRARYDEYSAQLENPEAIGCRFGKATIEADRLTTNHCIKMYEDYCLKNKIKHCNFDDLTK